MAELFGNAGGLESARGPQYRKALLPWEQQFCETLGISTEEYFDFYELVAQQRKEEEGRELIPDIRNETTTVLLVASLVISAGTAAYALLQPKPRAPEQKKPGESFQGSDVRGRTKFAPLAEFQSVQDLAALGGLVPLIFCRREGSHGGVRAESQMLWSKMLHRPTYQELRALLLFSAGELADEPAFEGFAFGDSKITAYPEPKLALWFTKGLSAGNGNKPFAVGSNQYSDGTKYVGKKGVKPFYTNVPQDNAGEKMIFCGVVTPSQSATFGQYAPMRNGQGWKYAFKWPGKGDGDKDLKEQIYGTRRKHVTGYHAGKTTLRRRGQGGGNGELTYRIFDDESDAIYIFEKKDNSPNRNTRSHFTGKYGKLEPEEKYEKDEKVTEKVGGLTEGVNAIEQAQIDADTTLDVGELYLLGATVYRCTSRKNEKGEQGTPFVPNESGNVQYDLDRIAEYRLDWVSSNYYLTNSSTDVYNEKHIPLQKVALGSISTTRPVNMVEIGIKSTVYRQVNGYPNISEFTDQDLPDEYAKNQASFSLGSITSYYERVSLFRMEIRVGDSSKWINWGGEEVFAVRGNNPQPQYNTIQVKFSSKTFAEFRFVPVCGNTFIANGWWKTKNVYWLSSTFGYKNLGVRGGIQVRIKGKRDTLEDFFNSLDSKVWDTGEDNPDNNTNPNSLLQDFWYYAADTTSHANEPEHQLCYCNEYVENASSWYSNPSKQYENLAYAGLIVQSAKEISSFSSFSAYFTEGIEVERLTESGSKRATNNFPEIAYNLLTNRRYGVGEFIGNNSVDKDRFKVAAKFCRKNGLWWDGVISQTGNVRDFLFNQSAFQLLDFTIIGGQFSLYPTVPFNKDYSIDFDAKAGSENFKIAALLTDGNIRNFRCTFLTPEERQGFIAEVKYRQETLNGFPQTRVTRVRLSDAEGGYYRDPVEAFDLSQFCTTRDHAIKFAKFALRIRQTVDHSISFETTPDAAHSLAPGDYIRVGVSNQHQELQEGYTERLMTGSVAPDGSLVVNQGIGPNDKDVSVWYWRPGMPAVLKGSINVTDGMVKNKAYHACLFTRIRPNSEARVYKVESISFSEDSFVEISASYVPLTSSGTMKLLDWASKDFVIEDQG